MQSVMRRCIQHSIVLAGIVCSFSALAAYQFTTVDYPGAVSTALWGTTESGQVIGQAQFADGSNVNFVYDSKKGSFITLPAVPGYDTNLTGINAPGVIVGSLTDAAGTFESGLILDKKGRFTTFSHPAPLTNAEGRAVGTSGLVTGFAYNADFSETTGFIFDPQRNTYTDFLDSPLTIAQGINSSGQVVGSVVSSGSTYGFLRDRGGAITLFQVNGAKTRARGINDSGQITGLVNGPGGVDGFVGTLSGFELLDVPGALNTSPEAIDSLGDVVGQWDDGTTVHGFIATQLHGK
jgi:hypothetical protein